MVRKLTRIGNSVGVTLDRKMLRSLEMDGVTWVWIEPDRNKNQIIIRKREDKDW